MSLKYNGSGNFAVINYDAQGQQIDLLVNTIGKYEGTIPLDFARDFSPAEKTARLSVESSGEWEIQILPIEDAGLVMVKIPATIQGVGDDVVWIVGLDPDLLIIDATKAESNFAVWGWGPGVYDLLVNEIAPYSGTVIIPMNTVVLIIQATGPWSIEVTTK